MKEKIGLILILILTMLIGTVSFAASSYDTFSGGSSRDPDAAADGAWAYAPVTGTRYVFRINGVDIGGDDSQNYYINHVRNTLINSDGLTYYNPREKEEGKASNKRNWEMVYVGTNKNNTIAFLGDSSKYYFFDEPSSSLQNYSGTYRHIIIWARRKDGGKLYIDENANFGLDKEDVEKLVGAVETRIAALEADGKDVSLVESQIESIKNGTAKFEIRSEVLMAMRLPDDAGSGTIKRKDVYAEYNESYRAYYTYREAWWIQAEIENYAYGPLRDFFKPAAKMLRELDDGSDENKPPYDYITEYASEANALKTELTKIGSKWWGYCESYYYGWDYMEYENPYELQKTKVDEKLQLEDGSTIDFKGYPNMTEWEDDSNKEFTRPEIPGYEYIGMKVDGGSKSENTKITETISGTTKTNHEIIYVYRELNLTQVIVTHKTEGGTILSGPTTTIINEGEMVPRFSSESKWFGNGFEYTGVEILRPTPSPKNPNKTYVDGNDIQNDGKIYEIIFWYAQKVEVKVIGVCTDNNQIIYEEGPTKNNLPYVCTIKPKSITGYDYSNKYEKRDTITAYMGQGANVLPGAEVKIDIKENEQKQVFVIFYYTAKYKLTVKHVNILNGEELGGFQAPLIPGVTKSVSSWSNSEHINHSVELDGKAINPIGFVKYGTTQYTVDVIPDNKNHELIFYYTACNVTVNHYLVDTDTKVVEKLLETGIAQITEAGKIVATSVTTKYPGLLNYDVKIDGIKVTPSPFVELGNTNYNVTFDIEEGEYVVDFYYLEQKVIVKHQYEDGKNIVPPVEKSVPTTESKRDDYPYKEHKLNDVPGTAEQVQVPVVPGKEKQELIFIYGNPDLYVDPNDPDPERARIGKELGLGLIPDDINNQYINQKTDEKYWVLDEKSGLNIAYADYDIAGQVTGHTTKITFPFDVYIGTEYLKAGNPKLVSITYKKTTPTLDGKKYVKWEGRLEEITVPIWVTEEEYKGKINGIKVEIIQHFKRDYLDEAGNQQTENLSSEPHDAYGNVTVVGKIYDFSVTNILGDDIWKSSLFTTNKPSNGEYEADKLPIGQKGQQNTKYLYGLKQGTKIYFSINTKGKANDGIKIVPSFYYVAKDGNTLTKVRAYTQGNEITTGALKQDREATTNDERRVTAEYTKEMTYGKTLSFYANMYKLTKGISIGKYGQILINTNLRTPYLGYKTEEFSKLGINLSLAGKTDNDLYEEASHWYADWMLPNDTVYKTETGAAVPQEGYVIVYFSIVSTRDNGKEYLAYNLPSGGVANNAAPTQWEVEQKTNNKYVLPMIMTNRNGTEINSWLMNKSSAANGAAPVIIYQISEATTQNYDTVGTH